MTTTEQVRPAASPDRAGTPPLGGAACTTVAPSRRRRRPWPDLAVALVALSPFLVGAAAIIRRGFPPGALFGDRALLALSALDAWQAPALLGPYSRFYWHHPGPLYFYVLQGWSALFGNGTVALVLGATAVNAAAAVGVLVLAFRRGGRALLVWAGVLLTAYLVAVDPLPFDIWNPSVTLLPFVVVLLLTWSVSCGDWWAAPWLALVASFGVQTHVGLAPGVAVAAGFAAVVAVLRTRPRRPLPESERCTIRRALAVTGVVTVVVWIPPVVEELRSGSGNLSALLRFFTRPGSPHTLTEGVDHMTRQATLIVRALSDGVSVRADVGQGLALAVAVTLAVGVAGVVIAWRARAADATVLFALVVVELAVGVYAVTRIVDDIQFYLVQWISAVGFVLWLAVGSAAVAFVRSRRVQHPRWQRRVLAIAAVVALAFGAIRAWPADAGLINEDLDVPNNRELFGYVPGAQLLDATREGRTVVLRLDSVTAWEVMAADALLLVQHGRDVVVVETPETRLLFPASMLVARAPDAQLLAFRDRPRLRLRVGESEVADQGEWTIVDTGAR